MSKTEFNVGADDDKVDAQFNQKINMEYILLTQINRCGQAAFDGDEARFNNAVETLVALLPKENRARIESEKFKDMYVDITEEPVFKMSCGKPMGSVEHPVYRNHPEDWNYKGGEPELVSPIMTQTTVTNYQTLYKLVLSELQDIGVTWKVEQRGNVDKRIIKPATPLLMIHKTVETPEPAPETEPEPETPAPPVIVVAEEPVLEAVEVEDEDEDEG